MDTVFPSASNTNALCQDSIQTPCLVVDRQKVQSNIKRLRRRIEGTDVSFRPHLKTVKSYPAALLAMDTPEGPATVSTLKEAEEFGGNGVSDLLYAVCISPQKLRRVTDLRRSGVDLKIIVDSTAAAQAVAAHSMTVGDPVPTLIEVDVDGHRSGVQLNDRLRLIEIGRILHEGGAALRGVMTHAGASYEISHPETLVAAADAERAGIVSMAETLRAHGLPCPVVSLGSTPTAMSARSWDGVTELRAGVFMFFDLFQAGVGVCSTEDIAMSVLATVIGHQRDKNWIITDAGWTALSSDRSTAAQAVDHYLGAVCDIHGERFDDLVVLRASQEHGILAPRPGSSATIPQLEIGDRVRILPNHACATAAQHERYTIVDGRGSVVDVWPRFNGW